MDLKTAYRGVVGLEVHIRLSTLTKAFSPEPNSYGEAPNTLTSITSLGQPGSLPKLNSRLPEYALKLGLAAHCSISSEISFARKNYFYADLPKGYQISQHKNPLCTGGYIPIRINGKEKRIRLNRIHVEEDAGKSIHDRETGKSRIDLNRAGVPLLEMVTEPDLSNGEEAYRFLQEVRRLVRYLQISDGDMEKGSIRCDANVSVKRPADKRLGTRTEIKNLNSINFVRKAIDHEITRQVRLKEKGGMVSQQTMRFDEHTGKTTALRSKEEAHDYRYFPEPDLNPVTVTDELVTEVKNAMPELPWDLASRYTQQYGLPEQSARMLSETPGMAAYFEIIAEQSGNASAAANWLIGPVRKYLNEHNIPVEDFVLTPHKVAGLIDLVEKGVISHTVAAGTVFTELISHPEKDISGIVREKGLAQSAGRDYLLDRIRRVMEQYPDKVKAFNRGKKGLLGFFMGEIMKSSGGIVDPGKTSEMLREELEKSNNNDEF